MAPVTVGGTGEIVFDRSTLHPATNIDNTSVEGYTTTGRVTFGPGVTLRAGTGAMFPAPPAGMVIQGRVSANTLNGRAVLLIFLERTG